MTLREYPDVDQGSDEWLALRCGMVTASIIGNLITSKTMKPADNETSRRLTQSLAAERITGHVDPVFVSDDMYRGTMDEPIARDLYSKHYAPVTELGFMVYENINGHKIGYSPDGLVGDDGLLEIKSRRQRKQLDTVLADQVPAENMAQLQCGLFVSGRKFIDYVSYCGGMHLYVKRVYPDPRWFEAIIGALGFFEVNVDVIIRNYTSKVADLIPTQRQDLEIHI